jgi:hypothetical protein
VRLRQRAVQPGQRPHGLRVSLVCALATRTLKT